ncbi:hypothetical protein CC1G_13018 [Coprinopsis cinerea okayama7|uniref:Ribonuclease H1 N-terminal domain-containing protein n=1 Tax=Coprinopsis cinerea (strain Okayama-7 / 130 / ATCC MYA-4618 / FGSC 9003) TaxID=240176 RepID=A8N416_COPC7|nr:hypothetical protein CC1G_13018 [Coprinopsis cinerea okayama7\|eukprot:XP_001829611.1 hypothetical protein CC1G_13018 [Coprinopsis cinerea okayama7\
MSTTAPSSTLSLSSLVATCAALGINIASPAPHGTDKGKTRAAPPASPKPALPDDVDVNTLKTILEALSVSGYDLKDEAAELVTALEAKEAEEAASAELAAQLIAEDQAELERERQKRANALARAQPGPPGLDYTPDGDNDDEHTPASTGPTAGGSVYARDLNPDAPASLRGFVCANCRTYNLLRDSKETWYVVTAGRSVGIYRDWLTVQPMVTGVPGACYKRYDTHEEALAAWNRARANGAIESNLFERSTRRG